MASSAAVKSLATPTLLEVEHGFVIFVYRGKDDTLIVESAGGVKGLVKFLLEIGGPHFLAKPKGAKLPDIADGPGVAFR